MLTFSFRSVSNIVAATREPPTIDITPRFSLRCLFYVIAVAAVIALIVGWRLRTPMIDASFVNAICLQRDWNQLNKPVAVSSQGGVEVYVFDKQSVGELVSAFSEVPLLWGEKILATDTSVGETGSLNALSARDRRADEPVSGQYEFGDADVPIVTDRVWVGGTFQKADVNKNKYFIDFQLLMETTARSGRSLNESEHYSLSFHGIARGELIVFAIPKNSEYVPKDEQYMQLFIIDTSHK